MNESELRDGLVRLGEFLKKVDIDNELLECSPQIPMDSLHIPIEMEELRMDLVCNYMEGVEEEGMLQFFSQIELNQNPDLPESMNDEDELLRLCNGLNTILPIGHMAYIDGRDGGGMARALGFRYTIITGLDSEQELEKCVEIIMMLMTAYQFLCGALTLMIDGDSAAEAVAQIEEMLG